MFQHGGCRGGLLVDGKIRKQDALGIRILPFEQVKAWESNDRIAQATDPVYENLLYGWL